MLTPRTDKEEQEYWDRLLASEGLTVDRGRFPTGKRVSLTGPVFSRETTRELTEKLTVCSKCFGAHTEMGDCSYEGSST